MSSKLIHYKKTSCENGEIEEISMQITDNTEKRFIYLGDDGSLNICIPYFKTISIYLILAFAFIPWYNYIFKTISKFFQK